tara:strand:- start:1929 stop:2273 length:345 start_codon:yes stop_codon:yes gene_type:complete
MSALSTKLKDLLNSGPGKPAGPWGPTTPDVVLGDRLNEIPKFRSGLAEVASGTSTIAVAVGAAYDGTPAFATLGEAEAGIAVSSVVWNGSGTLTITTTAVTTADRDVYWFVDGR